MSMGRAGGDDMSVPQQLLTLLIEDLAKKLVRDYLAEKSALDSAESLICSNRVPLPPIDKVA